MASAAISLQLLITQRFSIFNFLNQKSWTQLFWSEKNKNLTIPPPSPTAIYKTPPDEIGKNEPLPASSPPRCKDKDSSNQLKLEDIYEKQEPVEGAWPSTKKPNLINKKLFFKTPPNSTFHLKPIHSPSLNKGRHSKEEVLDLVDRLHAAANRVLGEDKENTNPQNDLVPKNGPPSRFPKRAVPLNKRSVPPGAVPLNKRSVSPGADSLDEQSVPAG